MFAHSSEANQEPLFSVRRPETASHIYNAESARNPIRNLSGGHRVCDDNANGPHYVVLNFLFFLAVVEL